MKDNGSKGEKGNMEDGKTIKVISGVSMLEIFGIKNYICNWLASPYS